MDKRNALRPSGESVDERMEAARRNNNYLREEPAEKPQPKWKFKARHE